MVSQRDLGTGAAAAAASGALFLLGTGLEPLWWAAWLAPLPVLLAAPRTAALPAAAAAFLAWLIGECGLWAYYTDRSALEQPVALVVGVFVALAAVFACVVVGARALMRSGHPFAATALVPAAWVSVEYALSGLTPNGLFLSLAYTQLDAPALVQVAALTGPWGVTFAVLALPAAIAAVCAPTTPARVRLRLGALAVTATVLVAGYGVVRLAAADPATGPAVGALALDQPVDAVPLDGPAGRDLLDRYAAGAARLADAGARTVVLPEKALAVDATTLPLLADALGGLAADRRVDVVVGVVLDRGGAAANAALVFPADAGAPVEHRKHHLVPVLEDALVAGTGLTVVDGPGGPRGVLICKDMDYPGLVRDYRAAGARMLLVPALDFDRDAWLHSRMAVLRGVETGLPVVRAGRSGAVTVSDAYGRVLAEDRTTGRAEASVVTPAPLATATTPYAVLGDWWAWLCALLVAATALTAIRRRGGKLTAA
ncbi:nitrilase-related carbon-nitrogen hydrolase [Pseudonocardia lacus]|uniref:nitrilase-related carbon-nitrogen hydrolase n=1 Tax=Pseudonocardia lacus TaxID=2835865 RepID=UPI001BDD1467|nr:nitrilase-related carbon-nitrogen hydrolase [Pseudonocardia lacus]